MNILSIIRNLLLSLFLVYYSQGSFYPSGSIISQGALVLILCISGIFFFKTLLLNHPKSLFFKTWTFLLILNVIGFVFTGDHSNPHHFSMFKGILVCSLTFYPFYHLSKKGIFRTEHLKWFFIILLPITIIQYFFTSTQILSEQLNDNTDVVNNLSYSFVSLIPFVFLFNRNKIISSLLMLILIFFIIQGAKRGAFIAGIIGLLLFIYYQLRTVAYKNKLNGYIILIISISGLTYFGYEFIISNEFLTYRILKLFNSDGSSGRNIIYANIFESWYDSHNFYNILFGFGFAASLRLSGTGNFAHNDWLELLSNFGLLGVFVYSVLIFSVLRYLFKNYLYVDSKLLLITILLIWLLTSAVSMFYTSMSGYLTSIFLAYLFGAKEKLLGFKL
ncbi:hypothetical protein KIH41_16660 [Litoribacter ruber]|uniref:O-antigen ligase family protein n=1 Tax=Litoribacter ruber TaxID=702568 RepID=UPI001BDB6C20|nr:hypothetical protein [Litoribacter ruber]MBT0812921.1 hypothetical protein [Litoribacter ruber]